MYFEAMESGYVAPAAAVIAAPDATRRPSAPPPPAPSTRTSEITVLTYNVRGLPWPIARGRASALREIGRELAALRAQARQPDVVLIQEGFRSEISELVRASGYPYWARGPRRGLDITRLTGSGLHVLSDIPILEVKQAAYRDCAGVDCLARKGVMLVRLAPEGAPTPLEVVNTHMNARTASRASPDRALRAHNRQTQELIAFINDNRTAGLPLLVGGDFNVKGAPQRYYYDALERPYTVVSEFCSQAGSGCGAGASDTVEREPWLRSQDLQAFADTDSPVRVRPVAAETLFDADNPKTRLSDHAGYLVRYQLRWPDPEVRRAASAPVEVTPRLGTWGVRVSWKR